MPEPDEPTPELAAEIRAMVARERTIAAIQRLREATGWGLADAKFWVDRDMMGGAAGAAPAKSARVVGARSGRAHPSSESSRPGDGPMAAAHHEEDLGRLVEHISRITDTRDRAEIPALLEYLEHPSPRVVDAAASALGELKVEAAKPKLLHLAHHPPSRFLRGGIFYALMNLDCSDVVLDLMGFLGDDNFEIRNKAVLCIEDCLDRLSTDTLARIVEIAQSELGRNNQPSPAPEDDAFGYILDLARDIISERSPGNPDIGP